MIFYLLLSTLFSTLLFVILKKFIVWKIDTLHGIIVNYWVAASFAFLVSPTKNLAQLPALLPMWYVSFIIGFLFIIVFFITAKTAQQNGVAVASVASKMSMVIPIAAGLFLYNESMGVQKLIGIAIAIPAVLLSSNSSSVKIQSGFRISNLGLPLLLFFGAGLVDTCIKFAQQHYMNENTQHVVIMSIFACAGVFGLIRLFYEIVLLKKKLSVRSIGGGIILGISNYLSLFFLIKCLASPNTESSTVFAFVNIGIVITSFFAGLIIFKENSERNKILGIILAIVAIVVLAYQ